MENFFVNSINTQNLTSFVNDFEISEMKNTDTASKLKIDTPSPTRINQLPTHAKKASGKPLNPSVAYQTKVKAGHVMEMKIKHKRDLAQTQLAH